MAFLLALVVFMLWAIGHTNARRTWWQDERDAEQFSAELHDDGPRLAFADDIVAVAMLDGELGKGRPDAPAADFNRDCRPLALWYRITLPTEVVQLVLPEPEAGAR